MKFELNEITARLLNVNPRPEIHGEDKKLAADLKLEIKVPSSELAQFDPRLRGLLYERAAAPDLADQGTDDPTALRFPQLEPPLKWDGECVGAKVTIHHGISARSDLVLEGCLANEFRLEPLQGGTVKIGFRVQFHPDEKEIGKICTMAGTDIVISVAPPAEQDDLVEEK